MWGLKIDEIINGPVKGNECEEWYEIEWYDDKCDYWRFNNKFKTIMEAREFIMSDKVPSGKKIRIVRRTFEVIKIK